MEFSKEERDFYSRLEADSRAQFQVCVKKLLFFILEPNMLKDDIHVQFLYHVSSACFPNYVTNSGRYLFFYQEYAAAGTVKENYVNILLMLLRLRQACDHPLLVRGYDSGSQWQTSLEMAKKLPQEKRVFLLNCLEGSLAICSICNVSNTSVHVHVHVHACVDTCAIESNTWCMVNNI